MNNLEVLVSTMHQTNYSLLEKMNIQSDAIIVNQCDRNEIEEFEYKGNKIRFLSFSERGVGLSRNNALMRANAKYCLFADDDIEYVDGYKEIILNEFIKNPDADVIVFNLSSESEENQGYMISKEKRLKFYNSMRYGTVRVAVKVDSIRRANIYFSLIFGGGTQYSCGEDSLFIADCVKKGLKIYASPKIIGKLVDSESTWFQGFTDKYFVDKGVLYRSLFGRWAKLFSLQYVLRKRSTFKNEKGLFEAYKLMVKGVKEFNTK